MQCVNKIALSIIVGIVDEFLKGEATFLLFIRFFSLKLLQHCYFHNSRPLIECYQHKAGWPLMRFVSLMQTQRKDRQMRKEQTITIWPDECRRGNELVGKRILIYLAKRERQLQLTVCEEWIEGRAYGFDGAIVPNCC